MTEHAAVIFVFFFLAEYASIVLICMLNTMLFFGGYLLDYTFMLYAFNYLFYGLSYMFMFDSMLGIMGAEKDMFNLLSFPLIEGMMYGLTMGIKSCMMIFVFMWVSASFPSMRFDQLMSFSWTMLLPVVMAFIMMVPCIMYSFEMMSSNVCLF